jgi:hypothetical protein
VSVRTSVALIAVGLPVVGLVAACGSQVSPEAFYAAQLGTGVAGHSGFPTASAASSDKAPTAGRSLPAGLSSAGSSAASTADRTQDSGAFGTTRTAATSSSAGHAGPSHAPSHVATSSSAAPAACGPPTASTPTVVVCPRSGLHDGQTVHVYASGFQNAKPTALTKALVVTECADKGNDTQQGDCGDLHFVNPDADGRVELTITVTKVVGANKNVCGAKYKCLVSVAQPKQPPDYEADQHITFA